MQYCTCCMDTWDHRETWEQGEGGEGGDKCNTVHAAWTLGTTGRVGAGGGGEGGDKCNTVHAAWTLGTTGRVGAGGGGGREVTSAILYMLHGHLGPQGGWEGGRVGEGGRG